MTLYDAEPKGRWTTKSLDGKTSIAIVKYSDRRRWALVRTELGLQTVLAWFPSEEDAQSLADFLEVAEDERG